MHLGERNTGCAVNAVDLLARWSIHRRCLANPVLASRALAPILGRSVAMRAKGPLPGVSWPMARVASVLFLTARPGLQVPERCFPS
jgi:hypothetical protein